MKRSTAALIVIVVGAVVGLLAGTLFHGGPEPRAVERTSGRVSSHGPSRATSSTSGASLPACARENLIGTVVPKKVKARARPEAHARVIRSFPRTNDEGSRQVFLLRAAAKAGTKGGPWYQALLPMRPNGTYGWV